MSGVYIKGMKMPTSCSECGQFRWNNFLQSDVCRIAEAIGYDGIFQSENEGIDSRPSWCPLVPIPSHGRLIEADALYTRMEKAHTDWREHPEQYNGVIPVNADEIFVLTEAVIIPADKENNNG